MFAGAEHRDPISELCERLRDGPHDLGATDILLAEELARSSKWLGVREQQALILTVLASHVAVRSGSTRVPLGGGPKGYLGQTLRGLIRGAELDLKVGQVLKDINEMCRASMFDRVVGTSDEFKPLIFSGDCLYHQRLFFAEDRLVERLHARLSMTAEGDEATDLDGALTDEQKRAVASALVAPLTVVSGGPGTGKTAIIKAIVHNALKRGLSAQRIALAAPTGKASQRMLASISAGDNHEDLPTVQTLHRLLGYRARTDSLLSAIPLSAPLVLLGDADQLPSVDAGAILRDLVIAGSESSRDFAHRLTRSFRMDPADPEGSAILTAANLVNAGEAEAALASMTRRRVTGLEYSGIELVNTGKDSPDEFIESWKRAHILELENFESVAGHAYHLEDGAFGDDDAERLQSLFHHYETFRLLCVSRRHATGTERVNEILHRDFIARFGLDLHPDFCPGEPVLVRRNDYQRKLYNGDQGIIVRVVDDTGMHLRAAFGSERGYRTLPLPAIRDNIEVAHAITVHRAQGSEFTRIGVLLPPQDIPLSSREMLYTAITRARRSVVVVGSPRIVKAAIHRRIERFSAVAEKLSVPHAH
jgi:exodeoxyribonuclease V alpha subunit